MCLSVINYWKSFLLLGQLSLSLWRYDGWILELVQLLTFVVDLAKALNFTHIGHATRPKDKVEVSESVEASTLTLVEHHPVFVDTSIGSEKEDDVASFERMPRISIEIAVDHTRLVCNEALI